MAKKVKDAKPPTAGDVATLLGKSHAQFQVLTGRPGAVCEWRRYSKTAPWVVKVSEGDRTLFYITPGRPRVSWHRPVGRTGLRAAHERHRA